MDYLKQLMEIVGEQNVVSDEIELICYSRDMSVHEGKPDVIVFPGTTNEVSQILTLANEKKIPVTARGSGTSVTGAVLPVFGGILLDMSKMNRIKEIKPEDRYIVVEPGVICQNLNKALAPNYFFPPDPGSSSICTVGGMVSTNASGVRAIKYGTTKDYVLALEVVLADGQIIKTGTKAPKTSSGYDLTRLFVSAEGTLGVITEITFRIVPVPEYVAFTVASFSSMDCAGSAIAEIFSSGIPLSACEILDDISIKVVSESMSLDLKDIEGMLMMEVDGNKEAVMRHVNTIQEICKKHGGKDLRWSDDPNERAEIWKVRSGLVSALSRFREGFRLIPIAEDFGIPISKIPRAISEAHKISKANDIIIASFGHIGDGNLHTTFILDVRNKDEWSKIRKVADELISIPMKYQGTVTAEHGVGRARAPFLAKEHGNAVEVMRKIKGALDPNNILNPGKLSLDGEKTDVFDFFAYTDLLESPEKVKSFGKHADNEILICVKCGFCRGGCPVFGETSLESTNARGKVILAYNLLTGKLEPSTELADKLYQCTTCMNCTISCPSQIKVPDIVENIRAYLVDSGFGHESHKKIADNIRNFHNPFGEDDKPRKELADLAKEVDS
ncbi:MAG: FAD-binding oxidoreductase [Methanomassiliicoccales archaeon]|nr:MAG: FAD-binding oxidoreductase [Methanomassiliicoccales archaeon]